MDLYEQKYKEALGWMRSLYKGLHGATKEDAEHYFPELKEDEDEKMKREILELVSIAGNGNQFEEIKDWLEKQQNPIKASYTTIVETGDGGINALVKRDLFTDGCYGEKNSSNKVEPKTLNADEVIAWLEDQACLGWIEDIEVHIFVDKFKKDFGL